MAKLDANRIRELAFKDKLAFKKHTVLRMRQRRITADEVKEALQGCKIIECYPQDRPLPSGLVLGYTENNRAVHAVVAVSETEEMLWIITVYEPTILEWEEGFEKRRKER
ncbi:MAG: DUF4258 domain-containing protein [Thermodesulfobacteriota bacterium]